MTIELRDSQNLMGSRPYIWYLARYQIQYSEGYPACWISEEGYPACWISEEGYPASGRSFVQVSGIQPDISPDIRYLCCHLAKYQKQYLTLSGYPVIYL